MMPSHYRQQAIAIIDPNVLSGLGLQQILADMMPEIEVSALLSFDELKACDDAQFVHYFVASRIYFEHTHCFRNNASRSIVLVNGDLQIQGVPTLNVCQSQKQLIKAIMGLHHMGHATRQQQTAVKRPSLQKLTSHTPLLTPREQEVSIMLAKGLINKEIADRLNISMTTVITHRKNIKEKLHARSLVDIIVYVVTKGLVDVGEL
jgi:DNA-binding CsgD family transcriptional regulator